MAHWPYNTTKWAKLREAKLSETPNCEICARRGVLALSAAVDHFVPVRQGGSPFPELSGLLALCIPCHNEKTASFDRQAGDTFRRRFKGFDEAGNPIDPFDAWHGQQGEGRLKDGKRPRADRHPRRTHT